jgi:hypothetical protein
MPEPPVLDEAPLRRRRYVPLLAALIAVAMAISAVYYFASLVVGDDPDENRTLSSARGCLTPERPPPTFDAPPRTLREQIRRTKEQVEALRGLSFTEPVDARSVTHEELSETVSDQLEPYLTTRSRRDSQILIALGMLPPGSDIEALINLVVQTQIAGLYRPDKKRLLVGSSSPGPLGPAAASTLAHELLHAMSDQHFGLPAPETPPPMEVDELAALSALIEGEATVIQQRYLLSALSPAERGEAARDPEVLQAIKAVEDIPYVLRRSLEFPYIQGAAFVCDLLARDGWRAVARAYEDPPNTTYEILFPETYPGYRAVEPARAGSLEGSWRKTYRTDLGAADLLLMFEAPGDDPRRALDDPRSAAAAWRGGVIEVWEREEDVALAITLHQRRDADLCGPVAAWYFAAFPNDHRVPMEKDELLAVDGEDQDAVIVCDGPRTALGIAPTIEEARMLAQP